MPAPINLDQGRDPTMESTTTTSYAGQDQQGAAVNCGMVHGGSLVNGVCYHGSAPDPSPGAANQIGNGDVLGDIFDVADTEANVVGSTVCHEALNQVGGTIDAGVGGTIGGAVDTAVDADGPVFTAGGTAAGGCLGSKLTSAGHSLVC